MHGTGSDAENGKPELAKLLKDMPCRARLLKDEPVPRGVSCSASVKPTGGRGGKELKPPRDGPFKGERPSF